MNKLFCLAIVLVAYGPLSVFGDSALQEMGWVVGEMSSTELGPNGQYNCTPAVWNDGVHQYISFTTKTNDLPSDVFNTMVSYMAKAVGNAQSDYVVYPVANGNEFTLTYTGDYDPSLKRPSKLQSLVRVLRDYAYPSLANRVCQQNCMESESGWAYVGITVPLNQGESADTACNAVYSYLSSQGYLDDSSSKKISDISGSGLLELWSKY